MKRINYLIWRFINYNKFGKLGKSSFVLNPLKIDGAINIFIHDKVFIGHLSWIASMAFTGIKEPKLIFGEGCTIGNFNHIYATQRIEFGKNVLTADKVYISDNSHEYSDINMPIINQKIKQLNPVYIGDGTWIGENAVIMGVTIGKNCVIGANSIVNKNIPDYCVAVGNPVQIIKRYCGIDKIWKKTDQLGNFTET